MYICIKRKEEDGAGAAALSDEMPRDRILAGGYIAKRTALDAMQTKR